MKTLLALALVLFATLATADTLFSPALAGYYWPPSGGAPREGWVTRARHEHGEVWMNLKDGGAGWVPMNRLDGRLQVQLGVATAETRAKIEADDKARAAFLAAAYEAQAARAEQQVQALEAQQQQETLRRLAAAGERMAEEMRNRNWMLQDQMERMRALRIGRGY